jgi:ribosomal protein S17E
MKKIVIISVLTFLFIGTGIKGVLAEATNVNIFIERNYSKKYGTEERKVDIKIKKVRDESFEGILEKYNQLEKEFQSDYDKNRELISESSTVQQAFQHSKKLLNTCVDYRKNFLGLKAQTMLQLLVGHWSGGIDIKVKKQKDDVEIELDRELKLEFDSNQAGQISKGIVFGKEEIVKKLKNPSDAVDKGTQITYKRTKIERSLEGSLLGSIVPQAETRMVISLDAPKKVDPLLKNLYNFDVSGNLKVKMKEIVSQEMIDEAYSLTVSHMKIYYNLLFKTRMSIEQALKEKFSLFYRDLLYLLEINAQGLISKQVYEPLSIYSKSEYVTSAFEDYSLTLSSYFARVISKTNSDEQKFILYKRYMDELIQSSAIIQLGLVDPVAAKKLNLSINEQNSLFDTVYTRYYRFGNSYYQDYIEQASGEEKEKLKKDYKAFTKEMAAIARTGLITNPTLESIGMTETVLKEYEDQ